MKKLTILTLILVLTALVQLTAPPVQAEVSIPDAELAAVIRETLELPAGAAITADAMRKLTRLYAGGRGIVNLTGLEHAVNLEVLNLWNTDVSDVSALASLTNLEWLELDSTDVSDVSALANLTNLEWLELYETDVSDVSALASLTNLETLYLYDTDVSDVSALARLTNLETLNLWNTDISDVSALARLTNLETLNLSDTDVSDVSALASLTNLETLNLSGTDVSDVSTLANLTNLEWLELDSTDVSDVSALASLTNLEWLELYETDVSDVSALASLTNLVTLYLYDIDVSDVSALARLTNLETLSLWNTDVSDVSALARLTNLETLELADTDVSDVSALASLTNLEWLELDSTDVSDVSALANLTNLEWLELADTDVSDVSALASLTNLEWLWLNGCPLSYASIHTHIPALEAKGIVVNFENVAHPALLRVSGDGQEGAGATAFSNPFVVEAMDEHGKPIVGRTVQFDILEGGGRLNAKTVETDAQGNARVTLTLGSSQGVNKVRASSAGIQSWVLFTAVATEDAPQLVADVNGDGVVNIQDLVLVAGQFGKTGEHVADVNGDGIVNIQDLVLVAGAFGEGAAAPSVRAVSRARLTVSDVEEWLIEARGSIRSGSGDASRPGGLSYGRGIAVLERLLASLMPKETALLANYPNPFNPETWIPYQLSKPAEVTVTIYAANGAVVRILDLGHRRAGSYDSRGRAAYWDGRNAQGESVASGVYFYTLSAGDFSATRKMVIRK